MQKPSPPSYEEAIAVFQHAPTAPTIGNIESAGVLQQTATAPTIATIDSDGAPLLSLVPLTDPELRESLNQHKSDLCCFGSRFSQELVFTDIQNDCAFHHKMESFGEKRECIPRYIGYYGQNIDGPENGSAPDKWSVPVGMPTKFIEHHITTEVPHTAYVKECSTCEGVKEIECTSCWARGMVSCSKCDGRGKDSGNNTCFNCRGSGNEECRKCSGSGKVDCCLCDGYGKVKYYMQLNVTWKNHVDDWVSNRYNLPEELILEASGQVIYTKQANQVEPLNTAHAALNEASAILIEKHTTSIRNEAILAQRLSLRAVPLTKATYIWRKNEGEFYVYGFERKVYFTNYPRHCCGCVCC